MAAGAAQRARAGSQGRDRAQARPRPGHPAGAGKLTQAPAGGAAVETAPAKLNLYLHVVGRRADGYHLLDSLVAFTEHGDVVRAAPAPGLSLRLDGPFAEGLDGGGDNLAHKAAAALQARVRAAGAALALTKNLPVAAGLGGGSADAAATLRALVRLWQAHPGEAALLEIAGTLGADVPVCVRGVPAYFGGIGDQLAAAPRLPPAGVVLVNPRIALSTAKVFAARRGPFSAAARLSEVPRDAAGLAGLLAQRRNDLEPAARELVPAIATVLEALGASPGCRLARMAGSGATCFGLYDNPVAATTAAAWLADRERAWWTQATRLTAT
ncbi:MAG: 4-(cytidine 5'-diphospho)-2-C-methyl-D-erythritol kinase [Alphaproteobacteria bacterium]|nr:4-(cytidine 5'-diphospho)-2-C-methyl-D-erythritol kinase [Alphaproteobacteria bacterium]